MEHLPASKRPGATFTHSESINHAGAITGRCQASDGGEYHGFLRTRDGTVTVFDASGALDTYKISINDAGTITGTVYVNNYGYSALWAPLTERSPSSMCPDQALPVPMVLALQGDHGARFVGRRTARDEPGKTL